MSVPKDRLGTREPPGYREGPRKRRKEPSRYVQVLMTELLIQEIDFECGLLEEDIRPKNRSEMIVLAMWFFVKKMRSMRGEPIE